MTPLPDYGPGNPNGQYPPPPPPGLGVGGGIFAPGAPMGPPGSIPALTPPGGTGFPGLINDINAAVDPPKTAAWRANDKKRARRKAAERRAAKRAARRKAAQARNGGSSTTTTTTTRAPAKAPAAGSVTDGLGGMGAASGRGSTSAVNQAVNSAIGSAISPLLGQQAGVQTQLGQNITKQGALSEEMRRQLASLAASQGALTAQNIGLAGTQAAALAAGNQGSGAAIQQMAGGAPADAAAQQSFANAVSMPMVQAAADQTGNAVSTGLDGKGVQDFYSRAQAVSNLEQQQFAGDQRNAAGAVLANIRRDIATEKGKAGLYRRQFQQEDDKAALERLVADRSFGLDLAGLKLNERQMSEQERANRKAEAQQQQQLQIEELKASSPEAANMTDGQLQMINRVLYGELKDIKLVKTKKVIGKDGKARKVKYNVTDTRTGVGAATSFEEAVAMLTPIVGPQAAAQYAAIKFPNMGQTLGMGSFYRGG